MESKNQLVIMEEEPEISKSKKIKGEKKEYKLMSYDELPEYMKENEYIRDHYRAEWPMKHALLSLFSWHNETLNIWTYVSPRSSSVGHFTPIKWN